MALIPHSLFPTPRPTAALPSLVLLSAAVLADHHLSELATALLPGESFNGTLAQNDNHYFELPIDRPGTLTVYTEGSVNTYGEFMELNEKVILFDDDSGEGDNFRFQAEVDSGSYFVRVAGATPFETGPFTLVTAFLGEGEAASPEELALEINLGSVRNTDNSASAAVLMAGAALENGLTSQTEFSAGDSINIHGAVLPQPDDEGKAGEIFVVIRSIVDGASEWLYRDLDGVFRPWDTKVPSLQPAYAVDALGATEVVEIHAGALQAASHRIFIGYRPAGGPLHYNTNGLKIEVSAGGSGGLSGQ